jgi:HSP20 family protein
MLSDFRNEFDQMLSRFFDGGEPQALSQWTPRVNVAETDQHYEVTVDLPGMQPKDFEVEVRHGDLWISGQRTEEHEEQGKTWHRIERHFGQFRRVIRLGDDADVNTIDAEYKDGVLRVHVTKSEHARTKKVEVKS